MTPISPASRAAALPPDARRRQIIDAVIPLLVEHGPDVTTRQIAAAAGVAEGTLFRVFEDKPALLHAAAHAMLDPELSRRALAATDPDLTLDAMVRTVADGMLQRMGRVMAVLMALRGTLAAEGKRPKGQGPPAFVLKSHAVLLESLTALFGRYRDELGVEPARAALLLRALVFGARQPGLDSSLTLSSDEIATALLTGISARRKGNKR